MGIIEQIITHVFQHYLMDTPEKELQFLLLGVIILAAWFFDYALRLFNSSPAQSAILFAVGLAIAIVSICYLADGLAQQCACVATIALFLSARRWKVKRATRSEPMRCTAKASGGRE
jgi:hypothetical protein